jgi:hypothetical protein
VKIRAIRVKKSVFHLPASAKLGEAGWLDSFVFFARHFSP